MTSKKPISPSHTTPAASKDSVVFAPAGFLSVTPTHKTPCKFIWQTIDGGLNGIIELQASPELLEPVAFSRRPTVQVELFDLKFRVRKRAYNKSRRTRLLLASSFFSEIARALARRGYAGSPPQRRRRRTAKPRGVVPTNQLSDRSPHLIRGEQ